MRIVTLSAVFGVSFIATVLAAYLMNWVFWMSLAVLAGTCLYINRHEKEIESELDEMFGRDDELH